MWFFINIVSFESFLIKLLAKLSFVVTDIATQDKIYYWFVKIFISAVLVTIANYVFSKFLVFGKKKKETVTDEQQTVKENSSDSEEK